MFIILAVVPALVLATTFILIPTARAISLSFQDVGVLSLKGKFVGFDNYTYLKKDKYFIQALKNTLKLMVTVTPCVIATAFVLAFILHQCNLREKNLYIIFYFLPNVISSTVLAILWSFVYHPNQGILNNLLSTIGLSALRHTWLGERGTSLWCIAFTIYITCYGYYMIMLLAGMDSIDPGIYESATLDGAGFWRKMFNITIPIMKNVIGIAFVLNMSGVLGASYVYSMVMTNGAPNGASNVLLRYIYQQGMEYNNMGYASAVTVVTLILAVTLSIISRKITNSTED